MDQDDTAMPAGFDVESAQRRYDAVRLPGLKPFRRDDGSVLFEAVATREGVLEYTRADGSVFRELVTPQAVLDTARTLPRSVVTLEHPTDASGKRRLSTSETYKQDSVGDIDGESSMEEDAQGAFVRVKLAVRRSDAVQAVDDGIEEVSAGYLAIVDPTPGVHPIHGRYDARQVARKCNHLALVPRGRAGSSVALLRADSDDAVAVRAAPAAAPAPADNPVVTDPPQEDTPMKHGLVLLLSALGVERLDSEDAALADGLAAAKNLKTDAEKLRADAADKADMSDEVKKLKADNEKLAGENEAMRKNMADLKAKEKERADAAELSDLRALGAAVKLDGADKMDAPALRLALVQSKVPTATADWSAERMDGVLSVVRADAASEEKVKADSKPFGQPKPVHRTDSADGAGGRDPFRIPSLDGNADGGDQ